MMSGPVRNFSAQDGLKRQFAVWSLAIFGSLSGSGVVRLDHSDLWASDDSPGSTASGPDAQADKAKSDQGTLTREKLMALLQSKKVAQAIERIDAAIATDPSPANYYLSYILASSLSQQQPALAVERFNLIVDNIGERLGPQSPLQDVSTYTMSARMLSMLLDRSGQSQQALDTIDKASAAAERAGERASSMIAGLISQRCRLLVKLDRADEAKSLLERIIDENLTRAQNGNAAPLVSTELLTYGSLFRDKFPEQVDRVFEKVEALLLSNLEREDATLKDYTAYQTFQLNKAEQISETSAKAADELFAKLQERATQFADRVEENEKALFERSLQTLKAARTRMSARLLHETLIGQPAPELEIGEVVNMDKVQWPDLKGKVVLLDFWAVWCGPCIATFPHLQHLHREYGERGLVIVGVTRQYGYTWDDEGKRAVSKAEATLEEEIAMLDEFRRKYELEHGFLVTPPGSEFSKRFGVSGIPQAVLVDQNGVIQLIRVGSGEKNASDIEAKIKELLGVTAESADKAAG